MLQYCRLKPYVDIPRVNKDITSTMDEAEKHKFQHEKVSAELSEPECKTKPAPGYCDIKSAPIIVIIIIIVPIIKLS